MNYSILISEQELNALIQSLDSAVRHDGIKSVTNIAILLGKLQSATPIPPVPTETGEAVSVPTEPVKPSKTPKK